MIDNFGDKLNTNGFDKNPQNINRKGQPISFKAKYRDILSKTSCLWTKIRPIEKIEDGEIYYGLELANIEKLLARISQLAEGRNDRVALEAIKFLWQQFDGKAKITTEDSENNKPIIDYEERSRIRLEMLERSRKSLNARS